MQTVRLIPGRYLIVGHELCLGFFPPLVGFADLLQVVGVRALEVSTVMAVSAFGAVVLQREEAVPRRSQGDIRKLNDCPAARTNTAPSLCRPSGMEVPVAGCAFAGAVSVFDLGERAARTAKEDVPRMA